MRHALAGYVRTRLNGSEAQRLLSRVGGQQHWRLCFRERSWYEILQEGGAWCRAKIQIQIHCAWTGLAGDGWWMKDIYLLFANKQP